MKLGWDKDFDEGTAADLYVDGSRPDDTGNGLMLETAKRTIAGAMSVTIDGDVIMVRDHGQPYRETVDWTGYGGSKLVGYGTDKPTISGSEILTGLVPCRLDDEAIVGLDWVSIYKKTGIPKSSVPGDDPRTLNLYENNVALNDRLPTDRES